MFIGNENEKPDSKYLSEKEIALKELRKSFLEISDRFRFEVIKCQLNAYESISDYKKAEEQARKCYVPYAFARRHTRAIIENIDFDFTHCMTNISKADFYSGKLIDVHKNKCLSNFKEDIKNSHNTIFQIYSGYLKNLTE